MTISPEPIILSSIPLLISALGWMLKAKLDRLCTEQKRIRKKLETISYRCPVYQHNVRGIDDEKKT